MKSIVLSTMPRKHTEAAKAWLEVSTSVRSGDQLNALSSLHSTKKRPSPRPATVPNEY